jgi:hypothetical protein
MGWTYQCEGGMSLKNFIAERVKTEENENGKWEYIKHALRGRCLWSIMVHTNKKTNPYTVTKIIAVDLIGGSEKNGWGYKDMSEEMGPCFYTCPLSYLDEVPDPGSYATEWRKAVREYHAKIKTQRDEMNSAKIGDKIILKKGCRPESLTIVSLKPLRAMSGYVRYKVSPRHIDHIEHVQAVAV